MKVVKYALAAVSFALLAACGGGSTPSTYTIGGSIAGLAEGNSVTLSNNGAEQLAVNSGNSFTFKNPVTGAYAVSVATQPYWQSCSVANGSGSAAADVTTVAVSCSDANAVVTTLAGTAGSIGSADGTGVAARFTTPYSVAVNRSGDIYVADYYSHTIRKITAGGVVSTFAGSAGEAGSTDATGSAARFYYPSAVAVDSSGNVYVAEENHTIRKITVDGAVTTLAGTAGRTGRADGLGSVARFDGPSGIAVDSSGNLYVAEYYGLTIRKITAAGLVTTLAGSTQGSDDGAGTVAKFDSPTGIAVDSNGNVYVADTYNHTIRKITAAGTVTTLAGTAGQSGSTDGAGANARFNEPSGVAADAGGNLYVADEANKTIRKITAAGIVTTLAGTAGRIGSTDASGTSARFLMPKAVSIDLAGNVYVADMLNRTIRKVTPTP